MLWMIARSENTIMKACFVANFWIHDGEKHPIPHRSATSGSNSNSSRGFRLNGSASVVSTSVQGSPISKIDDIQFKIKIQNKNSVLHFQITIGDWTKDIGHSIEIGSKLFFLSEPREWWRTQSRWFDKSVNWCVNEFIDKTKWRNSIT